MSVLGFWLKVLAALVFAFGLGGIGYEIENGEANVFDVANVLLLLGGIGWMLMKLGERWHEPVSALDFDVADRPASRRFRPVRNSGWLPYPMWRELPDPLPGVPDVTGNPETDIPHSDVPPDQALRRLWLVRAQLATHLDKPTVKARRRRPQAGALAVATAGLLSCVGLAVTGATDTSAEDRFVLGPLLAMGFLLWPFARSLLAYSEGITLPAKRRRALEDAEARLMALDAERPGGPLGGPAVQPGQLPYVPPSVPSWRLP